MNFITKFAYRLMLVAAGILMFAGIPHVDIQTTDHQISISEISISVENPEVQAKEASKHGDYSSWGVGTAIHVLFSHCGAWQIAALVGALVLALAAIGIIITLTNINVAAIWTLFRLGAIAWACFCEVMWIHCINGVMDESSGNS
ncbi:MAG: hypothetical protein F4039_02380 [Gammaproteobacteria bacterium]|nr:hypothetical protein [Gammaproteobacteria bacterium]MYK42921.1 hypothetical protein [Gammaproteobacteria bacterium]